MVDNFLALDTSDSSLGGFFNSCKLDLEDFFRGNQNNVNTRYINGVQLNSLTISTLLNGKTSFVFGGFSHGSDDSLVVSATTPYISIELNNEEFENAFFYTWSCSSGKILGHNLISNNCASYIGYKHIIGIWSTYQDAFVRTATLGIKLFVSDVSSKEIVRKIKEAYNEEIDKIYETDFIIAGILRDNRDALVFYGKDISIGDL